MTVRTWILFAITTVATIASGITTSDAVLTGVLTAVAWLTFLATGISAAWWSRRRGGSTPSSWWVLAAVAASFGLGALFVAMGAPLDTEPTNVDAYFTVTVLYEIAALPLTWFIAYQIASAFIGPGSPDPTRSRWRRFKRSIPLTLLFLIGNGAGSAVTAYFDYPDASLKPWKALAALIFASGWLINKADPSLDIDAITKK